MAEACSCFETPTCAAAGQAELVVVGTALETSRERVGGSLGWMVTQVAVTRTLRGSAGQMLSLVPNVTITAADIEASNGASNELTRMSTCDFSFEAGQEYVIYARRTADGRWTTSKCAGTKPIAKAAADFDYFADLVHASPNARVYGSVTRTRRDPSEPGGVGTEPASGVRVVVSGPSSRVIVRTDANGEYDVSLPPGEYSVSPVVPSSVKAFGSPRHVSVPAYACALVRFSLTVNGQIDGRVAQVDGQPAPGAPITLVPIDETPDAGNSFLERSTTSDAQGRFAIDAVMPGRYLLGVNVRLGPREGSPYGTTYLLTPGGERRVVEIGDGARVTGFRLVVTPLTQTTVTGHVMFADGRPAAEANLAAFPVGHLGSVAGSTKANATGDFELRVFTGLTYVVRVGASTPAGYRMKETEMTVDGPREGVRLIIDP